MELDISKIGDTNISSDLYRRSIENPDRLGIIFENGESLTYGEWENQAAKSSSILTELLGIQQGDRVMLYLQNSLDLVCLLFGCWKAGVVPITLSVMYNSEELFAALGKTKPKAIFVHSQQLKNVQLASRRESLGDLKNVVVLGVGPEETLSTGQLSFSRLLADAKPTNMSFEPTQESEGTILFTGGTTGLPKAVTVTHFGTRQSLEILAKASKMGLKPPYDMVKPEVSPNLLGLPLFHSGGQQALLFALFVGRSMVLMERFRVETLERLVLKYKIDNLFLMPTMLYDIVHSKTRIDLAPVRSVLIAGQALDPSLKQQFESGWKIPVVSNYGSTEIGHVAGWTSSDLKARRWKAGPVGRIYDGVTIEIRDENGHVLPAGAEGEIWVKTSLSKAYVDETHLDEEVLNIDGWVGSGDIGYIDGDRLLYLVGRKRDLIKTGGFQVWPQEIEQVLRTHSAVADVAVVGISNLRLGEIPKAFLVLGEGFDGSIEDLSNQLTELCREKLAHFKCVKEIEVVSALPRSEAGKVQRGELISRSNKSK